MTFANPLGPITDGRDCHVSSTALGEADSKRQSGPQRGAMMIRMPASGSSTMRGFTSNCITARLPGV